MMTVDDKISYEDKYLIFHKAPEVFSERQGENRAWIRHDVKPFDSAYEAVTYIINECIKTDYNISDFRIFQEIKVEIK